MLLLLLIDVRCHLSCIDSCGSQTVWVQVTCEKLPIFKIDCIGLVVLICIAGPSLSSHSAAAFESIHGVQHGFPHVVLAIVIYQGV